MDAKTLLTLEYPKILEQLAAYTAFALSAEKARALMPTTDLWEANQRQAETSEAVRLLVTHPELTIGGIRDIRSQVDLALHGGTLLPVDLLNIKSTLVASRDLTRSFERWSRQYPILAGISRQIPTLPGMVDAITRSISDQGEVLDSASKKLAQTRHDLQIVRDRLLSKMQHLVADPKVTPYLQEALVTQREGRYVLPMRADFKGRIRAIVHDQSASGATLFVEPIAVVELNNQLRELQLAEEAEVLRILSELSHQVGAIANQLILTLEVIAELDLILARARYSQELSANQPTLHAFPKTGSQPVDKRPFHPGSVIRLYQTRHPLLNPDTVVPIDVELDPQTFALVLTGPNTGGKTVALKTVGLLALMAQSGMHIPAQSGSEISLFQDIYADIGDEQSIEQSLSTFSGHITNIIHILKKADRTSLVILDELGAGTDPQEGSALARAILTHLVERGITTLVTTHHPELKAFAHATSGASNASVEFDIETLQPTYHLTIGLPGRSNALAIAQRLGLPEAIITSARAELNPQDIRVEHLLSEIHRQHILARQAREGAERSRQQAEILQSELLKRLEKIEDERQEVLAQAHSKAEAQLKDLQQEIKQTRQQLLRARQPLEILTAVEEQEENLIEQVTQVGEQPITLDIPLMGKKNTLTTGTRVFLPSLQAHGTVTNLGEEDADVQVGVLRIRARLSDLVPTPDTSPGENLERFTSYHRKESSTRVEGLLPVSPGIELNLRGQRAEDALQALERYLEAAYLVGLPFVRIVHGKGTGKLRQVIRAALKHHTYVKSYESGGDSEGGEGVTVVKLAYD